MFLIFAIVVKHRLDKRSVMLCSDPGLHSETVTFQLVVDTHSDFLRTTRILAMRSGPAAVA